MTFLASPRSLAEAVEILERRPGVRPLAGCTDLMVCDPLERTAFGQVMDLLRIPELHGIRHADGQIEIGATTTFSEIRRSALIEEHLPALAAAAGEIGGWQIQNRATIGGNVANASPAGDSLPVLMALEAAAVVAGPAGVREIPFVSFYRGYRQTALAADEILVRLRIPVPCSGTKQFFRKIGTRKAQAISKVVVSLVGRVEQGQIEDYRLAAGSVAATPIRLPSVETRLIGRHCSAESADLAEALATRAVEPIDDVRSTATYRRFALGRLVRRMTLNLG